MSLATGAGLTAELWDRLIQQRTPSPRLWSPVFRGVHNHWENGVSVQKKTLLSGVLCLATPRQDECQTVAWPSVSREQD